MTKSYLDGEIDIIEFGLDFPYEVENRYQKLKKEDQFIAELIWDDLVEDGAYLYNDLNEADFKERITKHYQYIKDVLNGEVDILWRE